jgi:hypothetical protein
MAANHLVTPRQPGFLAGPRGVERSPHTALVLIVDALDAHHQRLCRSFRGTARAASFLGTRHARAAGWESCIRSQKNGTVWFLAAQDAGLLGVTVIRYIKNGASVEIVRRHGSAPQRALAA